MNILEVLKDDEESISLMYYGKENILSFIQLKILIDKEEKIIKYFENNSFLVNTIDEYIDYIFLNTCSQLKEILPSVKEELSEKASRILENIANMEEKYKKREINKYIRDNYKTVLSKEELKDYALRTYEIIDFSLLYIENSIQSFKNATEIYKYIVQNYPYRVFNSFKKYKSVIANNLELQAVLFSEKVLKEQSQAKIEDVQDALIAIKKSNNELYKKSIQTIYSDIKNRLFNTNSEIVMYTYGEIKKSAKLFKVLGENIIYDELNEELAKQEIKLQEYIREKGYHSEIKISSEDIGNAIKKCTEVWEVKSLEMTHTKWNNEICSRIKYAIENDEKTSFLDNINPIDVDVNEYFTYSIQRRLKAIIITESIIVENMLFDDENFTELINYMFGGIMNFINSKNIKIQDLDDDFNMLSFSLKNLIMNMQKEQKDELLCEYWNYSTLHLCIGILEKVLREIGYKFLKFNSLVPYSKLTLEKILTMKETEAFLGEANTRVIAYYLTSYKFVGKNIRNDICHHNNIKEVCVFDNTLLVIYLLWTVCNELLLKVINAN